MTARARVLWEEGMFLGPHHFQQWDRHHEGTLHERVLLTQPLYWGFTELEVDRDALHAGRLVLTRARGVFPDGTCFRIPEDDAVPEERVLAEAFAPSLLELNAQLTLAKPRPGATVVPADRRDRTTARFVREVLPIRDDASGLEQQIAVTRKNLRVLLGGEPADDSVTLPLAAIRRGSAGGFELSATFVPPCLEMAASPVLLDRLQRIFELLSTKSRELSARRGERLPGQAQFTVAAATGFWLLHTVNSYLPLVMHHHHQPRVHPEVVYRCLACLAGELCTFSRDGKHPKDIPHYDHNDPGPVFERLEDEVRALPGTLMPDRCVPIPLQQASRDTHQGRVYDEALLDRAEIYLAVQAEVPADKIIREIPALAKVSSPHLIEQIRNQAVRGVPLHHVPRPPDDIVARSGFHYFQLAKSGLHWDQVRETRTLCIYVPSQFVDAQIECMAVKKD